MNPAFFARCARLGAIFVLLHGLAARATEGEGESESPNAFFLDWQLVTDDPGWHERGGLTALAYDDKLWIMGGKLDNVLHENDVWCTTDGVDWDEVTSNAGWVARRDHSAAVFNDAMWITGGFDSSNSRLNDVWTSTDGETWTQATSNAAWSPRARHKTITFRNKLWLLGGQTALGNTDEVYSTTNGADWILENGIAPWGNRQSVGMVVFNDKLWMFGGATDTGRANDAWSSVDGVNWNRETANGGWAPRLSHASAVFEGRMWVLGGVNGSDRYNDAWLTVNGADWEQAAPASAPWAVRSNHATVEWQERLWVIGGFDGVRFGDVWAAGDIDTEGEEDSTEPVCPALIPVSQQGIALFNHVGTNWHEADLDRNGIPEKKEWALIERVLCDESLLYHTTLRQLYTANLNLIRAEQFYPTLLQPYEYILAGLMLASEEAIAFWKHTLHHPGNTEIPLLTLGYERFTVDGGVSQPFAALGDFDLDGSANICEFYRMLSEGAERTVYANYAIDPLEVGDPFCLRPAPCARACERICTSSGISAGFESALVALYDRMNALDPEASFDPATADRDRNLMIDIAHARLLDAVLADETHPIHCCVRHAWLENAADAEALVTAIAASASGPAIFDGFGTDDLETVLAGVLTISEEATVSIVTDFLDSFDDAGLPLINMVNYDRSAGMYLEYTGDADRDGTCNFAEYNALPISGTDDIDDYVAAALDAEMDAGSGPCPDCAIDPELVVEGEDEGTPEGEGAQAGEGAQEGSDGGEGEGEGAGEGMPEGQTGVEAEAPDGEDDAEGNPHEGDDTPEGDPNGGEGTSEAEFTADGEGGSEGQPAGENSGDGEGNTDGETPEEGEGSTVSTPHSADQDHNGAINLSELLRVIQFFNSGGFSCASPPASTEDGYQPGTGNTACDPHDSDYNPQDWAINLSELLRLIQFFNSGGYTFCPDDETEDGYCPAES